MVPLSRRPHSGWVEQEFRDLAADRSVGDQGHVWGAGRGSGDLMPCQGGQARDPSVKMG